MTVRLHVIVEGQTEEEFVKRVLAPHLGLVGVFTDVRCVMTSRRGAYWRRGGLLDYRRAETDIRLWMKGDQGADAWFSTMFDLYALPVDFPEFVQIGKGTSPNDRARRLETAFASRVGHPRFVPYIQVHEFEALIFADARKLEGEFLERKAGVRKLVQLADEVGNPEMIDDGEQTAPSKRIIRQIPEYEGRKASAGPLVVERIGLDVLRQRCQHFAEWLGRLERLAGADA